MYFIPLARLLLCILPFGFIYMAATFPKEHIEPYSLIGCICVLCWCFVFMIGFVHQKGVQNDL